jgi:hypothetical protein
MIDSSNQLRCVKCSGSLVPSGDRLSCVLNCPSDCQACSDSLTCTTCNSGFTIAMGNCTKNNCTRAHCALCAADQTCAVCDAYSTLSNGSCVVSCSAAHCSLCLQGSSECEVCADGYSLNAWNNECIPSPISGCQKVVDFSQRSFFCAQCSSGLTPSADQLTCVSNCSVSNCLTCSGATCSGCRPGYQIQGQTCSKISCAASNCLLCGSGQICVKCNSSYALSGGQCVAAQCDLPYCLACKIGSTLCDSCSAGFALNVWTG